MLTFSLLVMVSDSAGNVYNSFFILVQTCSLLVTVLDIAGRAYNGRFILVLTCDLLVSFFRQCRLWVVADECQPTLYPGQPDQQQW